jgi:hypothetical protein
MQSLQNINAEKDVRAALQDIRSAVKSEKCSVIGIAHTRKEKEVDVAAVEKVLGSVAFVNFMRFVILVRRDTEVTGDWKAGPGEALNPEVFRLCLGKKNLAPSADDLLYRIAHTDPSNRRNQRIAVKWQRPEENADRETFYQRPGAGGKLSAGDWLRDYLTDNGPAPKSEVIKDAKDAGYKAWSLEKAVTRSDEFVSKVSGFPAVATWSLRDLDNMPPL